MAENKKSKAQDTANSIAKKQLKEFTKNHPAEEFEGYISRKYFILSEKLLARGSKYIRIVNTLKSISIVLFLLFTGFALYMGNHHGSKMLWFSIWIALIFTLVFIFLVLDYFKNVFLKNLTAFLDNVEETEFKEFNFEYSDEAEENEDENNSENI